MNLFITPHPPIIISEIGNWEETKAKATIKGMESIAREINKLQPKIIAVITPHGNVFADALCINIEQILTGNFEKFGKSNLIYTFKNNVKMAKEMCDTLMNNQLLCLDLSEKTAKQFNIETTLDHGVLVPLHFITKEYSDFELIHISIGFLTTLQLYEAGQIISNILGDENVLIVSGDLSHKLTKQAPSGYHPNGVIYDKKIVKAIKNNSYIDILTMDEKLIDQAGQCAHKPLELFLGALEGYESQSIIHSYEGPFGVGYLTASIKRNKKSKHSVKKQYLKQKSNTFNQLLENEDEYITLARNTINEYIKSGYIIDIPKGLPEEMMTKRNGVFVSIKKQGQLRGCIGTINPTKDNIAKEIIENAISASTKDPRFSAISEDELNDLVISVDILFKAENIKSSDQLDVKNYGVIVRSGLKSGLLLPNLEGIDTVDEQITIAKKKANINEDEKCALQRFKVVRHE